MQPAGCIHMAGRLPGEGAGMTSIGLLPDAADDEDCTGEFLTFVVPPSGSDLGCSFCLVRQRRGGDRTLGFFAAIMSILGARGPDDTRPAIIVVPFFLTLMATNTLYYRKRLLAMPGWVAYGTLMSAMFFLIILGKSVVEEMYGRELGHSTAGSELLLFVSLLIVFLAFRVKRRRAQITASGEGQ
jgi:hypothetical protein